MGLMFIEYIMERRLRLEDILKQNGWGNSHPNPTDGKLMHIYFYRNYIFLKSDTHFNRCVMLLIVFPGRGCILELGHSKHCHEFSWLFEGLIL